MSVRRKIGALFLAFLITALLVAWLVQRSSPVLTIGIFAGSNWGVPQGEPYAIIDRTIEKFEEAHPGVRVQYVSGIQREDYAEWLAGEFLRGEEPDVFLLPTEDFELYAEKGGLRELSPPWSRMRSSPRRSMIVPPIRTGSMTDASMRCPART